MMIPLNVKMGESIDIVSHNTVNINQIDLENNRIA